MSEESDHKDALEAFDECRRASEDNDRSYSDETNFWVLGDQWDAKAKTARQVTGKERPMHTMNMGPSFAKQVINDIRQNRPMIKARPFDSGADIETALVMQGLIRNIQYASQADIAHDNAAECSVYGNRGCWRIDIDYCTDDSFDKDLVIRPIKNPLTVLGDPYRTERGSIDWNVCFVTDLYSEREFEQRWPDADKLSWDALDNKIRANWMKGEDILVAEWWRRDEVDKPILLLSDGQVMLEEVYLAPAEDGPSQKEILDAQGVTVAKSRTIKGYRVRQTIMNGKEALEETVVWAGKYIPIVEIVGDEFTVDGTRYLRSLLHNARGAQEQLNFWETTATEIVAQMTGAPFVGPEGAFDVDEDWARANTPNIPYLQYKPVPGAPDGGRPSRDMPNSGPALAAMQQAVRSHDHMKAILGMYNASLGAAGNEKSGVAINARKREGDVGSFNFPDNVNRGIHAEGLILLDLIPKIYTPGRVVRVLGEDGAAQNVEIGQARMGAPQPQPGSNPPAPKIGSLNGVFALGGGKYDINVEAGPSYTTQRQETAAVIGELMRADPRLSQVGGDIFVKNLDIKDGEELARRLYQLLPPELKAEGDQPQIPPQVQAMIEQGKQVIAAQQEEINKLKQDEVGKVATIQKAQADSEKNAVERDKTALARERLPIENAQAQAALVNAQKELEATRAQLGATTASTDMTAATTTAINVLVQAAEQLATAAQIMAQPKVKRGTAMKNQQTGQIELQTVETLAPAMNGGMQ